MTQEAEKLLFDQDQAAEYLTVSDHFLAADRMRKRQIPFVKVGRCVRYRKADLDAYLKQQTFGGVAAA